MRDAHLLSDHQIRGVDPNYRYQYTEYPKAITPPEVLITSAIEEQRFRAEHHMALPWDHVAEQPLRDNYYALAKYPKFMTPPQIIVQNEAEEQALVATWNAKAQAEHGKAEVWPRYMFHPTKGGKVMKNRAELNASGTGWHDTPEAAINAARGGPKPAPVAEAAATEPVIAETDPDKMTRDQLFAWCKANGVSAKIPIGNADLRAKVKAAMAEPKSQAAA